MKDLNIRAAKVLGWKLREWAKIEEFYEAERFLTVHPFKEGVNEVFVKDLKFTTSYDWAMLGVKVAMEKDLPSFSCALYGITEYDFQTEDPNAPKYTSELEWAMTKWCFTFTPAQITQAWVEVLEEAT